jgi:hypothetical protein
VITSDECKYCGKVGHWAHECRKKKQDEQAHTAEAAAEDALLMGVTPLVLW